MLIFFEREQMDSKYKKLRETLMEQEKWPLLFYFKFIVPNNQYKIDTLKALFPNPEKVTFKVSKNIRFVSVSCKETMPDVDSIIDIYEKASQIEQVIAL